MSEIDFAAWLAAIGDATELQLSAALDDVSAPPPLHAALQYALLKGGKRLRPAMLLAAAEMPDAPANESDVECDKLSVKYGKSGVFVASKSAWRAACALECMHCYSLVHDDLPCMDNSDFRRGKPSCHKEYGEAMALLAGDCLQTLAFELLAQAQLPGKAVTLLAQAAGGGGMGGGQALDLQAAAADEPALRRMHQLKTGALFDCALQLGLLCRPHQPEEYEKEEAKMRAYSDAFGVLFQIINDIKDETADSELGKTTYLTVLGKDKAARCADNAHNEAVAALAGDSPRLLALANMVRNAV